MPDPCTLPLGVVVPFVGDVAPFGWEDADGTKVQTPWSPLFGVTKPDYRHPAMHQPGLANQRYKFIIKVASPDTSPLDMIVREIFNEDLPVTQTERPQYVPN